MALAGMLLLPATGPRGSLQGQLQARVPQGLQDLQSVHRTSASFGARVPCKVRWHRDVTCRPGLRFQTRPEQNWEVAVTEHGP